MSTPRVAIVGAAGETGTSIVDGLLEAGNFVCLSLQIVVIAIEYKQRKAAG